MQYRELLQLVMHSLNKPSSDSKQQIGNISRKIAQCVTELAAAAEQLKDDDWVNPEDPTFIAENELMAAARSIENAGKKLSQLKPRREVKGKVSLKYCKTNIFLLKKVCEILPPKKSSKKSTNTWPGKKWSLVTVWKIIAVSCCKICLIFLVVIYICNRNTDI